MIKSAGKVDFKVDKLLYKKGVISRELEESVCSFINSNNSFNKVESKVMEKFLNSVESECKVVENRFGYCSNDFYEHLDSLLNELAEYIDNNFYDLFSYEIKLNIFHINRRLYICHSNILEHYLLERYEIYFIFKIKNSVEEVIELHEFLDGFASELYKDYKGFGSYLDKLYKNVNEKADCTSVKDGKYTCIVAPSFSGLIAHESIGHISEYDVNKYYFGENFLEKNMGSRSVNIIDYAYVDERKNLLPCPLVYDDEGTQAKDIQIIKNGTFINLLTDDKSCCGVKESTGNSRIGMHNNIKMIRMKNTAFSLGNEKLENMISSIKHGYYLVIPGNGLSIPKKGFEIEVSLGFEIRDGKIFKALPNLYAFGEYNSFFKSIDMVSDKIRWTGALCNKKNEEIYLGMGGPALRCELYLGSKSRYLKEMMRR